MGEWRYSWPSLDLGAGWRCFVSFTRLPLYPRENSPQYPLYRRLGEPQSLSVRCAEDKNLSSLELNPDSSATQLVAQSLFRLRYPSSGLNTNNKTRRTVPELKFRMSVSSQCGSRGSVGDCDWLRGSGIDFLSPITTSYNIRRKTRQNV
jgi:hypothetical protein